MVKGNSKGSPQGLLSGLSGNKKGLFGIALALFGGSIQFFNGSIFGPSIIYFFVSIALILIGLLIWVFNESSL